MNAVLFSLGLPLGLHIHDGILRAPWLAGGFAVAGVLALGASYRVREEEIPRIALLTAAFFVASSIHLPLGSISVHLLLNGLVGVVLGRRAPLAILVGVGLQAVFGHGGFTTLGVNASVQMLPALLAAGLFAVLARLSGGRRQSVLWIVGFVVGTLSVLAALLLDAAVLLWGGSEDWGQIVRVVFLAHLPVVAVEGIVLGFTVSFLARVKPDLIGLKYLPQEQVTASPAPPIAWLAFLALFATAESAFAHRLHADYFILPERQVRIESYFDDDKAPQGATIEVRRSDDSLLAEGRLDSKGCFLFRYTQAETLNVTINAGGGHQKTIVIPRERLEPSPPTSHDDAPLPREQGPFRGTDAYDPLRERIKDALLGISFLLSVAAFAMSWRNSRKLARNHREPPRLESPFSPERSFPNGPNR